MSTPAGHPFRLALRPRLDAVAAARAWLLPGGDPAAWLAEVSTWNDPAGLRLFVLPTSIRDRTPSAVLVVPRDADAARPSAWAQPYTLRGGRLFLPCDARLFPEVGDDELVRALVSEVAVIHPAIGLCGFASVEALAVADLLAPPARSARRPEAAVEAWDEARTGEADPPRLERVRVERPPTVEGIIASGRDDIGDGSPSDLGEEDDPPPADGDRDPGAVGRAGRFLGRQLAKGVRWATKPASGDRAGAGGGVGGEGVGEGVGEAAGGSSWVDRLHAWADRKVRSLSDAIENARERELERLLHLLETDPDRGLRYALPIGGDRERGTAPRGIADPGWRLGSRMVDYDPSRVGGGGAVDPWDVGWEVRQKLHQRYREAANRELAIGRHRRAAYIFAQLLGDYAAAAAALEEGRFYREAAELHRRKLGQPLEAARCLERGGLLDEAAELYAEQEEWEKAGDLRARLGRKKEAIQAWRCAVEAHRSAEDPLAAARILEEKVRAPEEALGILAVAWPWDTQAARCLEERIDLLGRLGRHDGCEALVDELVGEPVPGPRRVALAELLAGASTRYPDRGVRAVLSDATRVIAGRRLARATGTAADEAEVHQLSKTVARLVPEDRLLLRDAQRFAGRRREEARHRKQVGASDPVSLVAERALPAGVVWAALALDGAVLHAVGHGMDGITAVRTRIDVAGPSALEIQETRWRLPIGPESRLVLAVPPNASDPVLLAVAPGTRLPQLRFPAADGIGDARAIGAPDRMPEGILAAAYAPGGALVAVTLMENHLALAQQGRGGAGRVRLLAEAQRVYDDPLDPFALGAAHVASIRDGTAVAFGRFVGVCFDEELRSDDSGERILGLAVPPTPVRPRIAVVHAEGGRVYWTERGLEAGPRFGQGLHDPVVCFTRAGHLVVAGSHEGRVYRAEDRELRHRASFDGPGVPPVAIAAGPGSNEVVVLLRDGRLRVHRITVP